MGYMGIVLLAWLLLLAAASSPEVARKARPRAAAHNSLPARMAYMAKLLSKSHEGFPAHRLRQYTGVHSRYSQPTARGTGH